MDKTESEVHISSAKTNLRKTKQNMVKQLRKKIVLISAINDDSESLAHIIH